MISAVSAFLPPLSLRVQDVSFRKHELSLPSDSCLLSFSSCWGRWEWDNSFVWLLFCSFCFIIMKKMVDVLLSLGLRKEDLCCEVVFYNERSESYSSLSCIWLEYAALSYQEIHHRDRLREALFSGAIGPDNYIVIPTMAVRAQKHCSSVLLLSEHSLCYLTTTLSRFIYSEEGY